MPLSTLKITSRYKIRIANQADHEQIEKINHSCFSGSDRYGDMLLDYIYESSPYHYVATNKNNVIVGYILSLNIDKNKPDNLINVNEKILVIASLAVMPDYRELKIASKLLERLICEVKDRGEIEELRLQVRISNHQAFKLYSKFGFKVLEHLENYYADPPEHGYLMRLQIV